MSELREWFKVWALKAINSADLDDLSDHEERVWWRLLMWASLEDDRWHIRNTPKLAGKCASTERKFTEAVAHFQALGMVSLDEAGRLFVTNGPKWNEETERRKPSDNPDATRERQQRSRQTRRASHALVTRDIGVTPTPVTPTSLKEGEKEGSSNELPLEQDGEGEAPERLPLPVTEIRDLILSKLPGKYQRDATAWEEAELFGMDFAGQHAATATAIDECRRDGLLPFPRNLRKHMPGNRPERSNGNGGTHPRRSTVLEHPDDEDPLAKRLRLDAERRERERQLGVS